MFRRMQCIPCKTKDLLLLIFILWCLFFVVFWFWSSSTERLHVKCPEKHDIPPFLSAKTFQKKTAEHTPVYIVEEHHEVLPRWFGAADIGLIPKQGNVLLHIDGHSDGAPPQDYATLSLFQYPKIYQDVRNLMQQNDVFIVGAAQTGLITRYIWVWPPWESSMAEMGDDHVHIRVHMGLMKNVNSDNPACACIEVFKEKTTVCVHVNDTLREEGLNESAINKDECIIKKSALVEIVSEDKALELSSSDNWITAQDNIILDIDEDYYGCEAAIVPLFDVGMSEEQIDGFSSIAQAIFCPRGVIEERQFDDLFYDLLQKVKLMRKLSRLKSGSALERVLFMKNGTKFIAKEFYETMSQLRNGDKGVCKDGEHTLIQLNMILIRSIVTLSIHQLTALSKVGLCLQISPKTTKFTPDLGMRLCIGFNRPNNSMVTFHTPTMDELAIRTANMESILKNVPPPSLVTICRSMRDGYAPLKYINKIERDILKTLQNTYDKITFDSIHYDSDLLGGRDGLGARHFIVD